MADTKSFDTGGTLPTGGRPVTNRTEISEAILTPEEIRRIQEG